MKNDVIAKDNHDLLMSPPKDDDAANEEIGSEFNRNSLVTPRSQMYRGGGDAISDNMDN